MPDSDNVVLLDIPLLAARREGLNDDNQRHDRGRTAYRIALDADRCS